MTSHPAPQLSGSVYPVSYGKLGSASVFFPLPSHLPATKSHNHEPLSTCHMEGLPSLAQEFPLVLVRATLPPTEGQILRVESLLRRLLTLRKNCRGHYFSERDQVAFLPSPGSLHLPVSSERAFSRGHSCSCLYLGLMPGQLLEEQAPSLFVRPGSCFSPLSNQVMPLNWQRRATGGKKRLARTEPGSSHLK